MEVRVVAAEIYVAYSIKKTICFQTANMLSERTNGWWDLMPSLASQLLGSDPSNLGPSGVKPKNPSDKDLQRAEGCLRVVLEGSARGTRLVDFFQKSPIRMMFPRVGGAIEEAVIVNTAGGITGGDRLEIEAAAVTNALIVISSQAAEKVYRALDEPACIKTKLSVGETARLAWLPQETITFNHGRLNRETKIELSSGAELLALEWLVLGRSAHGEKMIGGHISDSWRVKKDGRLIWADSFRITDEVFSHLQSKALLSDCKAFATLIHFGPDLQMRLELMRNIASCITCHCAPTSVGGLIIMRFAAESSFDLRNALRNFLQLLNQELGPGLFRVPKIWSC